MLRHQKNHRTQYEYTLTDSAGSVVYTLWTMNKSINKVNRLASDVLGNICKYTNTQPEDWTTCKTGIENVKAGITGKFTGETLLGKRGYAEEVQS